MKDSQKVFRVSLKIIDKIQVNLAIFELALSNLRNEEKVIPSKDDTYPFAALFTSSANKHYFGKINLNESKTKIDL